VARRKKTALVPRIVLSASFVSVIPACALSACGGPDPILQLGGGIPFGVAAVAFCCFDGGVADIAFTFDATKGIDATVDAAPDGDATPDDALDEEADAADDTSGE
jgi:hypothetical protein